jgi:beta-ureidopropionase
MLQEVNRLLTGLNCGKALETIALPESATTLSIEHDFDLQVNTIHFFPKTR